jgi:hypothetical protein
MGRACRFIEGSASSASSSRIKSPSPKLAVISRAAFRFAIEARELNLVCCRASITVSAQRGTPFKINQHSMYMNGICFGLFSLYNKSMRSKMSSEETPDKCIPRTCECTPQNFETSCLIVPHLHSNDCAFRSQQPRGVCNL